MFLTGGLGNQLFQLTALIALSENRTLVVDSVNGKPRGAQYGKPHAFEYLLQNVLLESQIKSIPRLVLRITNLCLRLHSNANFKASNLILSVMVRMVLSLLLSISLRELISVRVCRGLGFDPSIKQSRFNTFYIGYFQSYKWFEIVKSKGEFRINLNNISPSIEEFQRLAKIEHPLVVHVRLGDYGLENGFGTLGKSYYEKALKQALSSKKFGKIWMFSDDPEDAILRIPKDLGIEVRVMPDFNGSPSLTLEAMRLGEGYVIGNSTFSWWGATLSYEPEPIVIYPYPWFKLLDSPTELVPSHWSPVDAFEMGS